MIDAVFYDYLWQLVLGQNPKHTPSPELMVIFIGFGCGVTLLVNHYWGNEWLKRIRFWR